MKYVFLIITLILCVVFSQAQQWIPQTSNTSKILKDVHFLNPDYGFAVGDTGTILKTTNGGSSWTLLNINTEDNIQAVYVYSLDTIFVTTNTHTIYRSTNGGANWQDFSKSLGMYPDDISFTPSKSVGFAISTYSSSKNESLKKVISGGIASDTVVFYDKSTTILPRKIQLTSEKVGYISGEIAGFITYSAFIYRTDDGGNTWFPIDNFYYFPNANNYTTAFFVNDTIGYVFTNENPPFEWVPGTKNQAWKLRNFFWDAPYDVWGCAYDTLTMPGYITDAFFTDTLNGYVTSLNGKIYKTVDGNLSWSEAYNAGPDSLYAITIVDNNVIYAVGSNGMILKNTLSVGGVNHNKLAGQTINVYPSPAKERITFSVDNTNFESGTRFLLYTIEGKKVKEITLTESGSKVALSVYDLPTGVYLAKIEEPGAVPITKRVAVSH